MPATGQLSVATSADRASVRGKIWASTAVTVGFSSRKAGTQKLGGKSSMMAQRHAWKVAAGRLMSLAHRHATLKVAVGDILDFTALVEALLPKERIILTSASQESWL
jgi:hypothetical protein